MATQILLKIVVRAGSDWRALRASFRSRREKQLPPYRTGKAPVEFVAVVALRACSLESEAGRSRKPLKV